MIKAEVINKVREVIIEVLKVDDNDVKLVSRLLEDLGCDLLDVIQILCKCENIFYINIEDNAIDFIKTVEDIVNLIFELVNTKSECTKTISKSGLSKSINILEQANKIVSGDRNEQYGSFKEAFGRYTDITNLMLDGKEIDILKSTGKLTDTIICKVMQAIKLGRQAYKHKEDNLVDLAGYTHILNELNK